MPGKSQRAGGATFNSPPSDQEKIELFRQMLRIRVVEEGIAERYSEQQMRCPVHLSVGQEAAAVGACSVLRSTDQIVSTHRCHGHYLAKGGDLHAMLAELQGKETGCCGGRGGSMHLFDDDAGVLASVPIVGSNVPLGVGAALAFKQRAEDNVALACFGDGSLEEGVLHESANLAVSLQLPVVFFLENNLYSVYTPLQQRQPDRPLSRFAEAHDMPAFTADGNDVLAVRGVVGRAVARARRGEGPSLVVVDTYRWREHCGPNYDDHLNYRPVGELDRWKANCPVSRFEAQIRREGLLDDTLLKDMEDKINEEFQREYMAACASAPPASNTADEGVYA